MHITVFYFIALRSLLVIPKNLFNLSTKVHFIFHFVEVVDWIRVYNWGMSNFLSQNIYVYRNI